MPTPQKCLCGNMFDIYGNNAFACAKFNKTELHSWIRDTFALIFAEMAPYSKIVASQADVPVEPVELLPQHPSLMPANIDKIPSVSRILILVRESSSEFLFPVRESDVATTPFARNVPQTYPVTNGSIHFISFFYLKYLLTYDPFYIKRMPRASPSLHLIVPVHWGI